MKYRDWEEIGKNAIYIGIVLVIVAMLPSCAETEHSAGGEIDAIYWHEGLRYTVMVENAGVITKRRLPPWGHAMNKNIRLYTDAGPGEKAWYECEWSRNEWTGADLDTAYCDIHIHGLDELGTADWNHGKFGSGSTTRID